MVFAVQAAVSFRNASRRNTVMNNVQTRLQQNVPFGETTIHPFTARNGDPAFAVEVRFQTRAEQQSFWNDVMSAFGGGVNGPTTGSYISRHDCAHDSSGTCVVETRTDF